MRRRDTRQWKQALAGLKTTAGIEWMLGTLVRVIRWQASAGCGDAGDGADGR